MSEEQVDSKQSVEVLEKKVISVDSDNTNDNNDSADVSSVDAIPEDIVDKINEYLSGNDDNPKAKFLIKSNQPKEKEPTATVDNNKTEENTDEDGKDKVEDDNKDDEKKVVEEDTEVLDKLNLPTELDLVSVNRTKISEEFKACYGTRNLKGVIIDRFMKFNQSILNCEKSGAELKNEWLTVKKNIRRIRAFARSKVLTFVFRDLNAIVNKL